MKSIDVVGPEALFGAVSKLQSNIELCISRCLSDFALEGDDDALPFDTEEYLSNVDQNRWSLSPKSIGDIPISERGPLKAVMSSVLDGQGEVIGRILSFHGADGYQLRFPIYAKGVHAMIRTSTVKSIVDGLGLDQMPFVILFLATARQQFR